jgi:kinetochore protein NDC80
MKAELHKLHELIKTQNLSPEEVIRMNTEHETLSRNLEELRAKVTETNKTIMSLEVALTNRVAAAEEVVDTYNGLLALPGLIPTQDVDLTIELNMAASDVQNLVKGPDTRKVVKPTLSKWAETYRMENDAVKHERIGVEDDHDHVVNSCDDLSQEIDAEETKVQALVEQADELREVGCLDDLRFMRSDVSFLVGCTTGGCCQLRKSGGTRAHDSTGQDGSDGQRCRCKITSAGGPNCVGCSLTISLL